MSRPYLPNVDELIQMGINPKTGLPYKVGCTDAGYKDSIRKQLRILDEQDAVNRYTWYDLPKGLNAHLIERILYYKGQGIIFYMEANNTFYFLPYTLCGTIDCYGRYTKVTPITFGNGKLDNEKPFINGKELTPMYDIVSPLDLTYNDLFDKCVILRDYTNQLSQNIIPRQQLQDGLIDIMSDCIPFMRTALLSGTGVNGMRVGGQDEQSNVETASRSINRAALNGEKWIPIVGNIDFQELTNGNTAKTEEYLLALQGLDNYRLSLYGLDNGGLFQKKAHMLEAEAKNNQGNAGIILQDGLTNRQEFCNIVNSIWGLGIWVEPSETVINTDADFSGIIEDNHNNVEAQETVGGTEDEMQ